MFQLLSKIYALKYNSWIYASLFLDFFFTINLWVVRWILICIFSCIKHIKKVKCDTSKNIPLDEASALNQDSYGTTFIQLTLYSAQAKYSNTSIFVSAPLYS